MCMNYQKRFTRKFTAALLKLGLAQMSLNSRMDKSTVIQCKLCSSALQWMNLPLHDMDESHFHKFTWKKPDIKDCKQTKTTHGDKVGILRQ